MTIRELTDSDRIQYDKNVSHIVQSWEWGDFRKKIGLDLVRLGHFEGKKLISGYQLTFHPVPFLGKTVGYLPKGPMPDKQMVEALGDIGKKKGAVFIKLEPNVIVNGDGTAATEKMRKIDNRLVLAKKSLFTKHNFILDIKEDESKLLSKMHPKTRYNIGVAKKKGVEVYESTKDDDFEIYLRLYFDTTRRQKYFGHTPHYHKLVWETLKAANMARLLIAKYQNKPLVAWMLLNFGDTLYYPYGGSSVEHRDAMASNLVAWEAICLGKKMALKAFDMWGALGPDAKDNDPWFGFHRFKAGYGPQLVEYIGTYDLVLVPSLYSTLNAAEKLRWTFLRATRR